MALSLPGKPDKRFRRCRGMLSLLEKISSERALETFLLKVP
jgi:hypothetical protein